MAEYTITTNAIQEKAIEYLVRRENHRRTNTGQAPINKAQFIDDWFDQQFKQVALNQFKQRVSNEVQNKYDQANNTVQNQVRTALGIDPDSLNT
jgi:hypothetical protein